MTQIVSLWQCGQTSHFRACQFALQKCYYYHLSLLIIIMIIIFCHKQSDVQHNCWTEELQTTFLLFIPITYQFCLSVLAVGDHIIELKKRNLNCTSLVPHTFLLENKVTFQQIRWPCAISWLIQCWVVLRDCAVVLSPVFTRATLCIARSSLRQRVLLSVRSSVTAGIVSKRLNLS